jgi:hypothetical protein
MSFRALLREIESAFRTHCKQGGHVKATNIMTIIATIFLLAITATGYCDSGLPYNDTVNLIKNLLPGVSSDVRKESYGYIRFNKCILDYNVSGFYPVGTPYTITFSNIDFSSLNYQGSKTGVDSSHFIKLIFNTPVNYKTDSIEQTVSAVVIDAASNEQAQTLFKAFLRLGELCGAKTSQM